MKRIVLSEILNPLVVTVAADDTMDNVLSTMAARQVSCVIAIDMQRRPLGIFTEYDAVHLFAQSADISKLLMSDVMNRSPLCATFEADFKEAFFLLQERNARHLIVLDVDNAVLGLVTKGDLLRHMHDSDEALRQELFSLAQDRTMFKLHAAALQHSPNAVSITDINAVVLWVNPAFSELTGYAAEEVVGLQMDELVNSGKQNGAFYESLWNTILNGQTWRGEMFNRRKDGTLYHQEVTITPVCALGDEVSHFIAIKQDVTRYKQFEGQLREAVALMNTTHEGVMITDTESNILSINAAYSQITGYSANEIVGKNPSLFISGRADKWFFDKMWQNLQKDGYWQGEVWNRRKSGEMFPQLLTISAVYDEQQKPVRYLGTFADISQIKKNQEQLEFMAHHDPLTKLPNRSWIELRLKQEVERAQRQGYNGAILFIDLDRFKPVNDSFGHEVGDELLQAAAQRLQTRLRKGDTLGRLNGDEFILLVFPIRDVQDAAVIARDLIATLSTPFMLSCDSEIFISASVGISLYPQDGDTTAELLKNADAAMYLAKANGGNQFSFYSKELNASARSRLAMENDLRRALAQKELILHYQPKVDLRSGKICGAEALARWPLPGGGMVSPGEFIPIAEKSNLILTLGSWLIEQACWQMRSWLDQGYQDIYVAINISARQFRSGNLDVLLEQAISKYRLEPHHLELELTESMLMQEPELAVATMQKLKQTGVKISLDDFGTGYSSLAYLSRFPIDTLKIDQSFVRNITTDPTAGEIAMSIIDLAHRMNLNVIAEGVETEAQLAYLRRNNCDEIQGYFFSKPLPPDGFAELVRAGKSLPRAADAIEHAATLLILSGVSGRSNELAQVLQSVNYKTLTADDAAAGLEMLALNPVHVVLVVQSNLNALELIVKIKEIHPTTVCLLITAPMVDITDLQKTVNAGIVHKLLSSDINEEQLCQQVQHAFVYQQAIAQF